MLFRSSPSTYAPVPTGPYNVTGDVIMTGTPQGVGPVLPGDRIEAGVQGVGAFEIRVADAYAGAAAGA